MTYRILIVHDTEIQTDRGLLQWAYARRSAALQKFAPPDFSVDRCAHCRIPWDRMHEYDLAFFLDYAIASGYRTEFRNRGISIPLVVSFNKDANSRQQLWQQTLQAADFVVVNNLDRWVKGGRPSRTCCIANGIDLEDWYPTQRIDHRPHRVLWAGSSGTAKRKGYREIMLPLQELLEPEGFEFDLRPINDITPDLVYPTDWQRDWYNSGSYYLNASETEGTPSSALEAMACGCVYVSTPIGNVLEFGEHRQNCVVVEKSVQAFAEGLRYARNHRERLSVAGRHTMQRWSYAGENGRAQWFFQLFRRLIRDGCGNVKPFSYHETHWTEI